MPMVIRRTLILFQNDNIDDQPLRESAVRVVTIDWLEPVVFRWSTDPQMRVINMFSYSDSRNGSDVLDTALSSST